MDLLAEGLGYARALPPIELLDLVGGLGAGITRGAAIERGERILELQLGAAWARVEGTSDFWQPDPDAERVVTLPIFGRTGFCYDIVAWPPARPAAWALRAGLANALALEDIMGIGDLVVVGDVEAAFALARADVDPDQGNVAVNLFATPLAWLRAGGRGICVLDWRAVQPTDLTRCVLVCADQKHARAVDREVDRCWRRNRVVRPKIKIAPQSKARA